MPGPCGAGARRDRPQRVIARQRRHGHPMPRARAWERRSPSRTTPNGRSGTAWAARDPTRRLPPGKHEARAHRGPASAPRRKWKGIRRRLASTVQLRAGGRTRARGFPHCRCCTDNDDPRACRARRVRHVACELRVGDRQGAATAQRTLVIVVAGYMARGHAAAGNDAAARAKLRRELRLRHRDRGQPMQGDDQDQQPDSASVGSDSHPRSIAAAPAIAHALTVAQRNQAPPPNVAT